MTRLPLRIHRSCDGASSKEMAARRSARLPLNAALALLIVLYMPNWSRTRPACLWSTDHPDLCHLTVQPDGLGNHCASIGINRSDGVEFKALKAAFRDQGAARHGSRHEPAATIEVK